MKSDIKNRYLFKDSSTYHIHTVHGAEFERLLFSVEDDVDHGAELCRKDIVGGIESDSLFEPCLESIFRPKINKLMLNQDQFYTRIVNLIPLNAGFDHIARH